MDEVTLVELERLSAAATPGPWNAVEGDIHKEYFQVIDAPTGCGIIDTENWGCASDPSPDYVFFSPENAAFIAAARTAVPALVAEVRRQQATWDGLCSAVLANVGEGEPPPELADLAAWLKATAPLSEIEILRIERDELLKTLKEYGRHAEGCSAACGDRYRCRCGWREESAKLTAAVDREPGAA